MTTKEKIEKISNFLNQPKNSLIWNEKTPLQLGTFFDIEMSYEPINIDFSVETVVEGIEETITILKSITTNKDLESIREDVKAKLRKYNINPKHSFYLIIKGNRDERI